MSPNRKDAHLTFHMQRAVQSATGITISVSVNETNTGLSRCWRLCCNVGYEKCIMVGHDWGGIVAWYYAAMHPDRVERLIACNMAHPVAFEKHMASSSSQRWKLWYVFYLIV